MAVFNYRYDDLFNPTLKAVHELGGSGTTSEIEEVVSRIMNLSEEEINDIHRKIGTDTHFFKKNIG